MIGIYILEQGDVVYCSDCFGLGNTKVKATKIIVTGNADVVKNLAAPLSPSSSSFLTVRLWPWTVVIVFGQTHSWNDASMEATMTQTKAKERREILMTS